MSNPKNFETIAIRVWQIGGTDAAYLVSSTPKNGRSGRKVWLPRSQIEHVTRQPEVVGEWQECSMTLPLWLAEKKGLA